MILLWIVTFLHLPAATVSLRAHLSDALKLKCDALPYRSNYFDNSCFFAVLRKVEYRESPGVCSSIFKGADSKGSNDVPPSVFATLMLDKSEFHIDSHSSGVKYSICSYEIEHKCDVAQSNLADGRCLVRAAKKMNFADANNHCLSLGMTIPAPANDDDNQLVRDALAKDPAWVQRTITKDAGFKWKQGSDFSRWTTCDRPTPLPRLFAGSQNSLWRCAADSASVVDTSGYWSNGGTNSLRDVVCMKEAENAFTGGAMPCNYHEQSASTDLEPLSKTRICYTSTLTTTRYEVIDRAIVETRRGCEVLCDANPVCVAFSFKDSGLSSSCALLKTATPSGQCNAPVTVFVKKTVGCVDRTNITAEFGVDPCIDESVPSAFRGINQWAVCPIDKSKLYIVRAIDERGRRITLDNEKWNYILPSGDGMWLWIFYNTSYASQRIVAFTCALAGGKKCPCESLKLFWDIPDKPNYPAVTERVNPCKGPSSWIWWDLAKYPAYPKAYHTQADTARAFVTCKAGMWILWRKSTYHSWGITSAACYN